VSKWTRQESRIGKQNTMQHEQSAGMLDKTPQRLLHFSSFLKGLSMRSRDLKLPDDVLKHVVGEKLRHIFALSKCAAMSVEALRF